MSIFSKIKNGLLKTKQQMVSKISSLLNSFTKIDEDLFEQLEETLIMSDVGVDTSLKICDELRKKIKEQGIKDPNEIMRLIHEIVSEMMGEDKGLDLSTTPSVIMVIGVNGAGKTTTIGKLCHKFKSEGKKVLVAAADTFRAAAIDQLQVWTERAGVDIVKHAEGSDPAAVVFDAITAAKARKCDVLVVDTAGRLHNKKNLMDELAKINRIISQQGEGCAREVLLVLDATTGQNAVNQAKLFSEVADITGIVLTKLDGTAKGGIVISIKNELDIPVKLIGLGEKIDDLQDFSSDDFVDALFGDEVLTGTIHDDEEAQEESEADNEEETEVSAEEETDSSEVPADVITEEYTEQAEEEPESPEASAEKEEENHEAAVESKPEETEADEEGSEEPESSDAEKPEEPEETYSEEAEEPAGTAGEEQEESEETAEEEQEETGSAADDEQDESADNGDEGSGSESEDESEGKKKKSFFDFFRRKKKKDK